jgi:hypothetical protein
LEKRGSLFDGERGKVIKRGMKVSFIGGLEMLFLKRFLSKALIVVGLFTIVHVRPVLAQTDSEIASNIKNKYENLLKNYSKIFMSSSVQMQDAVEFTISNDMVSDSLKRMLLLDKECAIRE